LNINQITPLDAKKYEENYFGLNLTDDIQEYIINHPERNQQHNNNDNDKFCAHAFVSFPFSFKTDINNVSDLIKGKEFLVPHFLSLYTPRDVTLEKFYRFDGIFFPKSFLLQITISSTKDKFLLVRGGSDKNPNCVGMNVVLPFGTKLRIEKIFQTERKLGNNNIRVFLPVLSCSIVSQPSTVTKFWDHLLPELQKNNEALGYYIHKLQSGLFLS
jgi:hypothetical protein